MTRCCCIPEIEWYEATPGLLLVVYVAKLHLLRIAILPAK